MTNNNCNEKLMYKGKKYKYPNNVQTMAGYEPSKYSIQKSRILIVGTRPSLKGKERNFYYMAPQNRLYDWLEQAQVQLGYKNTVIAKYKKSKSLNIDKLKDSIYESGIVLFDTIKDCVCTGSEDDTTICYNLHTLNEFKKIFNNSNIKLIIFTSEQAREYFVNEIDINGEYSHLLCSEDPISPSGNRRTNREEAIEQWKNALAKGIEND